MSIRRIVCLSFFIIIGVIGLASIGHASTWVGIDGNLADENNWDPIGVPGAGAEALFDGTSIVNPTTGDLSPRWITFNGAVSYSIGGGTITIPSNGNIDTFMTTANQTFSNATLTFNGGAMINTAAIDLSISTTIFNVGGTTTITAGGGNITVAPAVNFTNATGTLILNGAATTSLNGGFSGSAKAVSFRMGTSGTLALGSSGAWAGLFNFGNGVNTNYGHVVISTADALGSPGDGASAYTDMGLSRSGSLVVNNTGSPIAIGEYIYLRGRLADNTPHITNQAGNNTFTGTIESDNAAGSGDFVTFQADAGSLSFTGSLLQSFAAHSRTLNLTGASTGSGLIAAPLIESANQWNVVKNGEATWTISVDQNYTGTTEINSGTLAVNADHSNGDAYTVGASGILKGTGSTTSAVSAAGIVAPGASIGTFAVGSLSLSGILEVECDAGNIDLLEVDSTVDVGLGTVSFLGANNLDGTSTYVFLTYGNGGWNGLEFGEVLNKPNGYNISYDFDGNSFALVPVPEPQSFLLLGMGFIALAATICRT